jgi:integral membrane sensor domain MASE1
MSAAWSLSARCSIRAPGVWKLRGKFAKKLLVIAALALAYFVTGKLGLTLAFVHPSSTAVWPPTGITLAAFLIFGYRVWPGIFLGAFFVNLTTAGTILTSLGIATGNTCEGLLGVWLVTRFASGRKVFDTSPGTFQFAILAGLAATTAAATLGVTSLALGGYAPWTQFRPIWVTWWLGDGVGAVLVAPVIILWARDFGLRMHWKRVVEMLALVASLILVAEIVFGGLLFSGGQKLSA